MLTNYRGHVLGCYSTIFGRSRVNGEVWSEIAASLAAAYNQTRGIFGALGLCLAPQCLPDPLSATMLAAGTVANIYSIIRHNLFACCLVTSG